MNILTTMKSLKRPTSMLGHLEVIEKLCYSELALAVLKQNAILLFLEWILVLPMLQKLW